VGKPAPDRQDVPRTAAAAAFKFGCDGTERQLAATRPDAPGRLTPDWRGRGRRRVRPLDVMALHQCRVGLGFSPNLSWSCRSSRSSGCWSRVGMRMASGC